MRLFEQQQLTDRVCWGARFAAFLQGRRPRGLIIPCKNAGILFRASSAEGRSDDGAEKREKREERKWPPARFTQDLDGKEKREERREEGEERGEKREEKRLPTRGRQRSANEAAREGPTLFLAMPPAVWTSGGIISGPRAEAREQRKEGREKRENGCQLASLKTSTKGRGKMAERNENGEKRKERRERRQER